MTEPQARAFMAQVEKEFPGQIGTSLHRNRESQDGSGFVVRLTLKAKQMTLTAYKPDEWTSIKQAWCWFLGLEPEEEAPPAHYLIDGTPMTVNCYKGYWYGRWQQDGKSKRKFLGKVDPRTLYPLVEKEEVTI